MIARRICIALVLVAFAIALVPADAAALPSPDGWSELGRTWLVSFFAAFDSIRDSVGETLSSFLPAHGATITGNGGE